MHKLVAESNITSMRIYTVDPGNKGPWIVEYRYQIYPSGKDKQGRINYETSVDRVQIPRPIEILNLICCK